MLRTTLPNPNLKQFATDTDVKRAGASWLLTVTLISSALEYKPWCLSEANA
jgi:hypothetical protein